jgi:hypothetical protein
MTVRARSTMAARLSSALPVVFGALVVGALAGMTPLYTIWLDNYTLYKVSCTAYMYDV